MITKIIPNISQLSFNQFGSLVYLLKLKNKNILIDTSSKENQKELLQNLKQLNLESENINIILLTHTHYDHNENTNLFPNAKIYDARNINELSIKDIEIIKTPGHTKDSLCFLYKDILFSGDTIFHQGGRGRTDLEGGSEIEIQESIKKLKEINYNTLCPGH